VRESSGFSGRFSGISEAVALDGGGWVRRFNEGPVFAGFFCRMCGEAGRLRVGDGGEDAENVGV